MKKHVMDDWLCARNMADAKRRMSSAHTPVGIEVVIQSAGACPTSTITSYTCSEIFMQPASVYLIRLKVIAMKLYLCSRSCRNNNERYVQFTRRTYRRDTDSRPPASIFPRQRIPGKLNQVYVPHGLSMETAYSRRRAPAWCSQHLDSGIFVPRPSSFPASMSCWRMPPPHGQRM